MSLCTRITKFVKKEKSRWPYLFTDIQSIVVLTSVLFSYILVSYLAVFDHRHDENIDVLIIIYLCDLIYLIDSIFRIITARKLCHRYDAKCQQKLKRFIPTILDVMSLLPLEICILLISMEYKKENLYYLSTFAFLKLNRVIRLYRVPVFYSRKTHELRLNLFTREVFAIVVSFFSFLIILFHAIACIWFRLRCFGVYSDSPPVCHKLGETTNSDNRANEIDNTHPYYRHLDTSSGDAFGWYIGGLHWSIMSIRNSGNRFLLPRTPSQMGISVSIQLLGFFLGTAMILVGIYIRSELDYRRIIFFHEANGARSFVKNFHMGNWVNSFLNDSFNFMWHNNRAYTDHNMKPILPKYIRTKINISILEPMIKKSEILRCFDETELEALSLDVHYKHYFANEFLIRPGTLGYHMYYLVRGHVEIMSEDDPRIPILTLAKGSLIGELNGIFPTLRRNGVKTQSPCDVIKLPFHKIIKLAKSNPGTMKMMTRILKKRMVWMSTQIEIQKRKKDELEKSESSSQKSEMDQNISGEGAKNVNDPSLSLSSDRSSTPTEPELRRRGSKTSNDLIKPLAIERGFFTGPQFMSVLAWVDFYKQSSGGTKRGTKRYEYVYYEMHKDFRNQASIFMYKVVQGIYPPKVIWERLIFSKATFVYWFWDMTVVLTIIFYSLIFSYERVVATPEFCASINGFVEMIYILDLLFRLFIFYDPSEMSPIVTVLSHILHEFHCVDIAFDIIAILPIHHIAYLRVTSYRQYLKWRLHTVIFKFFKLLKRFREWENDVTSFSTVIRIFKHLIFISVFVFWIASTYCRYGCPYFPDCKRKVRNESSWVDRFLKDEPSSVQENFPYAFPLSLYWAVCVTFGIGFTDDIQPSSRAETNWQSIGLILGFVLCAYFCADLASGLAGSSENRMSHHQDKAIWLDHYLDSALIDLKLIARVNHYLSTQWRVLRGISSDTTQAIGFLSVYNAMYTELLVHIVAESLFKTHYFKSMDTDLARKFCLAAKLVVIPPNEVIIPNGDLVRRLYVIRRGFVEVYLGDTNLKLDTLASGKSFGEAYLIYGVPSKLTFRSLTYAEIIIIEVGAFETFLPASKTHGEELSFLREHPEYLEAFEASLSVPQVPEDDPRRKKYRHVTKANSQTKCYWPKPRCGEGSTYWEKVISGRWLKIFAIPVTIFPTAFGLRIWETVRLFAAAGILFFVPLLEAHPQIKEKYKHYMYILDSVTFIDMIIRIHIAYYDSTTNALITHPLKVAFHYLTSGFLADLIGSLPVYLLIDNAFRHSSLNGSFLAFVFRLNRVILVYRLWGFCIYQNQKVLTKRNTWRILELVPLFFFHMHIMGCISTVLACPSTIEELRVHPQCNNGSWIQRGKHPIIVNSFGSLSSFQIYTFSFYYVVTTSVGCGFGDFRPANVLERTFMSFVFFCDIFILTYFLASMAGSKSHKDYKSLRYQQHMNYLVGYLSREKLESRLTSRIIRYYDYQWVRTKGIEPQKLFSNLLPSLRKEVAIFVFEDVINQIPILKDVPMGFLRSICVALTPIYFLKHDIIVRREDVCDTIYFIFRGRVNITNAANDEAQLDEGGIIGVLDPDVYNPIYEVNAAAITNVDMFTMRRSDFGKVLIGYPTVAERFRGRDSARDDNVTRNAFEANPSISYTQEAIRPPSKNGSMVTESIHGHGHGTSFSMRSISEASILAELMREEESRSDEVGDPGPSLSEVVALVIEDEEVVNSEDDIYAKSILPESKVYKILNIAVFFSACLGASLAAYQWAFKNFLWPYFAVGYLCDAVYIVKIILSFRVSFVDEMGDIITDFSEIENKYISDPLGFALDFLCTFPLEVFAFPLASFVDKDQSDTDNILWLAFRLNRIFRLIHIWQFYSRRSNGFIVNHLRIKLERLAVLTAIYFHLCVCILHGFTAYHKYDRVACSCDLDSKSSSEAHKNYTDCVKKVSAMTPETWFHTKSYDEDELAHSFCSPYIMTLYFVITTFTTTAYGDIYAITPFEMYFISFVAVSSKVWLGLALSDILSGVQNNTNLSYHLAADGVLKLYKDYGVPKAVLHRTIKYFTFEWVQNKGVLFPDFLSRAPSCLRMDISASIYGDHFRKSYLFRDLSESFIRSATIRLRHEWVLEKDFVVRQKETDDRLYFIHKGIIEYSKVAEDGTILNSGYLNKSRHFGEAHGILGPQPHDYSYKAQSNCDIISLSHADIEQLFEIFPTHRMKILRRFYGRNAAMFRGKSAVEGNYLTTTNKRRSSPQRALSLQMPNIDFDF